jgi:MYXO-CTERM domain-containing protein
MKHASIASVAIASFLLHSADAGMSYTVLDSLTANSTMTGPGGSWSVNGTYTGPSSDISWHSMAGTTTAQGYGGGSFNIVARRTYAAYIYSTGFIDEIIMQHDVGSSKVGAGSGSGSITVTLSQGAEFHCAPGLTTAQWTKEGSALANGAYLAAGTHTLNWSASFQLASGLTRGYTMSAYFAPSSIPAPGALALLGVAGLAGSRRRRA